MAEFKTPADVKAEVKAQTQKFRAVKFVQVHDSFSPLQMPPMMTLSMEGHRPMEELTEKHIGIYARTKPDQKNPQGREFMVPYANISHYEYANE